MSYTKSPALSIIMILSLAIFFGMNYTAFAEQSSYDKDTGDHILIGLPAALFKTDKNVYEIQYNITNARLEATFVDIPARAFMFIVNATEDGQLSVNLPRKIIDSTRDGNDRPYFVFVGDPTGGGLKRIKVDEIKNNPETRIVTINFTKGLKQVQLSGTFFVENNNPRTNINLYNGEMSPLKQWLFGADSLDVICKNGFQLIIKARGDLPACVKPETKSTLIERGWAFDFDSHYTNNGKITFVNFTKNNGIPKIENQNIRVYQGGFNSTVVFENQLDYDIVLVNDGQKIKKDDLMIDKEILIPKGKRWSFLFNIDNFEQDTDSSKYPRSSAIFQYHTEPDNLKGIITVKLHPECMTENEVKSLYSEVKAYPKFPSYLPDGYSFECGVHHTYWAVNLVYLDENGRKKMSAANEPVSHFAKGSLIDSHALIISYWNGYVANNWQKDPIYDKFEYQKNAIGFKGSKPITISGEPAVLYTDYYPDGRSANTLEISTDNAITYTITGNFTDNELVKVAESLFTE